MPGRQPLLRAAGAVAAVAAPTLLLASLFPRELMFLDTTAAGGDLGSHNYAAAWLRTLLLNEHRITGWVPGNYAGFPLFQMYFPLPFVGMVIASLFLGANVAFKLTTVIGILGLPAAAFLLLRRWRVPFPGPALAASLVLLFLFQDGNTMWGGNIASTLAGEFTYSISLLLALAWFAVHDAAMTRPRAAAVGAVVVALLSVTHAYTVLWVAMAAGLAVLMRPHTHVAMIRYATIFVWGGALCAFWLAPMIAYAPWTTAFRHLWVMSSITEVLPRSLWPILGAAIVCPIVIRLRGRDSWRAYGDQVVLLHAGALSALLAYLAAPNFGVVDIRFLPFLQLSLCLLAAVGAGHVFARWPAPVLWVPIVFLGAVLIVQDESARMSGWARWNFEGFERKAQWPLYRDMIDHLRGDLTQPRVAFEHSPDHEALGTTRAFENLPLFSGRSTLEGVNMQASVTSPFVFYVQSEISEVMSCPFSEWGCSRPDLSRGVDHLRMMNASDVIFRSDTMTAAAAAEPGLVRRGTFGPYAIYGLVEPPAGYVSALDRAPYVVVGDDWKVEAYRWFKRARAADPVPVFAPEAPATGNGSFAGVFPALPDVAPVVPLAAPPTIVERVEAERVTVTGVRPGQPLLIRISYHPRWQTTTGERVWLAGPGFMLVFPASDRLELVYGSSGVTTAGVVLSLVAAGCVIFVLAGVPRAWFRRDADRASAPTDGWGRGYRRVLAGVCVTGAVLLAVAGSHARREDADSVYRRGQRSLDAGDVDTAIASFQRARALAPLSNTAIHSTYFEAIALYREERWVEAGRVFQQLADRFPEAHAVAESLYHVGLCASRAGDNEAARRAFDDTIRRFGSTYWAGVARDRLGELDANR